jgi:hypothetical protein
MRHLLPLAACCLVFAGCPSNVNPDGGTGGGSAGGGSAGGGSAGGGSAGGGSAGGGSMGGGSAGGGSAGGGSAGGGSAGGGSAGGGSAGGGSAGGGMADAGAGPLHLTQVTTAAMPLDAVPDPSGQNIYFTAFDSDGGPGVYKVAATGSNMTPTTLWLGDPFVMPMSIAVSSDGQTLFIADPGATTLGQTTSGDVLEMSAAGGAAPVVLNDGNAPTSVFVQHEGAVDQLYFTGTDKTNGQPGVFRIPATGGAVTPLAEGAPYSSPEALTLLPDGGLLVVDMIGASGVGLFQLSNGVSTLLVRGFNSGWPGGLVFSPFTNTVLVSARVNSPDGGVAVPTLDPTSGALDSLVFANTPLSDPGGLRRASAADVYTWVDTAGFVYVITH